MDAQQVLATARSGEAPPNWMIWPLRRNYVRLAALKWAALSVAGFALFIPALLTTIPANFTQGDNGKAVFSAILLAVLGFVAVGSLGLMIYDIWRLAHEKDFLLVMTPDDYVKAEPGKVTHVPMDAVSYVTLRGVKIPADHGVTTDQLYREMPRGMLPRFMMANPQARNRSRGAPSLAFLDDRTKKEVIVGTDDSFDSLIALEQMLLLHTGEKERQLQNS